MVKNLAFFLCKPWPKTQLSLAENPTLSLSLSLNLGWKPNSLSLNLWPKTQLSLCKSVAICGFEYGVLFINLGFGIWVLSFVFGFLESIRKFGLSFVFGGRKSGFYFCLCVIVECLWVLSQCNCWKNWVEFWVWVPKFCLCNCGHVFVFGKSEWFYGFGCYEIVRKEKKIFIF